MWPQHNAEGRQGVRRGLGAKFLNGRWPAGWPGQGLRPLVGACTAKSGVSSKQEKSERKNAHVRRLVFTRPALS